VPFIETYPFLIPKSYTEPFSYNHDWFLPDLYECETQVRNLIKSKKFGELIYIFKKKDFAFC
jgi:hypothetical protein